MTGRSPIDPNAFRTAMGSFPTGVTIITTIDADGHPVGVTVNSFNSVSLDPPLVLWSLSRKSHNFAAFQQAQTWAVHILAADQEALSGRFATSGIDKFAGVDFAPGPDGIPLLAGCAARFTCRMSFEYDGGDHAIFVGEVTDLFLAEDLPLVFHGGRYRQIMPAIAWERPDLAKGDGEFGRYFTGHVLSLAYHSAMADVRREFRKSDLRSSDYTVLASLGLGDDITFEEVVARARRGGLERPEAAIDRLISKGAITRDRTIRLSDRGRHLLIRLIAVAQETQLRLEQRLSPQEMGTLHDLLLRLARD